MQFKDLRLGALRSFSKNQHAKLMFLCRRLIIKLIADFSHCFRRTIRSNQRRFELPQLMKMLVAGGINGMPEIFIKKDYRKTRLGEMAKIPRLWLPMTSDRCSTNAHHYVERPPPPRPNLVQPAIGGGSKGASSRRSQYSNRV